MNEHGKRKEVHDARTTPREGTREYAAVQHDSLGFGFGFDHSFPLQLSQQCVSRGLQSVAFSLLYGRQFFKFHMQSCFRSYNSNRLCER